MKRVRVLACLAILAVALAAGAETAKGEPSYKGRPAVLIAKAAKAPVLDGKLDDECWQQARPLVFHLLDGTADKPKCATWAKLVTTDDTLYLAFYCADPEPGKLVSEKRPRDSSVWEDDSVELFLRLGPEPNRDYRHLIVNPAGSFLDALGEDTDAWQSELKLATATGKDHWAVEIAIPLGELYQPADKQKLAGPWRMNLTRMRPARGDQPVEETALSPTEDPSNHVPEKFAYAFFEVFGGKVPQE
jgi:hypothetical protein